MKVDKSKLVATSQDFSDPEQKILIANDENHFISHSKKRVRFLKINLKPQFLT